MGKRKSGKKADRRINTLDVTDFLERETREERQGLAVDLVPDADLFFVDKAGNDGTAVESKQGKLPRKLAARQKVLHSQAILQAAHAAMPVAKTVARKPKGRVLQQQQHTKQQQSTCKPAKGLNAGSSKPAAPIVDLWDGPAQRGDGWTDGLLPAKRQRRSATPASRRALITVPSVGTGPEALHRVVPAVEIDPAGCSFNPDPEQHQEAVAAAVAVETRKLLDKDLQPLPIPRTVDYQPKTDELALLQTFDTGPAVEEEGVVEQQDGEEDGEIVVAARRKQATERKTKKNLNRYKRRRDVEELLEEQRKLKAQRRELSSLHQIQRQLQEEEEEMEAKRLRRQLDKIERLAAEPPKLSKHRFQPMPLQVLTTDEVAGSLRRLKPTAMLAKDRFKSLQKRALIEPRRKIEQKKQGKKVEYIQGERAERAAERQHELQKLCQAKKKGKAAPAK